MTYSVKADVRFFLVKLLFSWGLFGRQQARQTRVAASGISKRNAPVLLARRLMNGTLNQDTEHHESCQRLS